MNVVYLEKLKKYLFNNLIFATIILTILFKPYFFSLNSIVNNLFNIASIFVCLIIIYIYIARKKINKFFILIGLYCLILLLSTIINNSGLIYLIYKLFRFTGFVFYIDILLDENKENFFKPFLSYFSVFNILNFFTILINNNRNVNRNYFLGYDNDLAIILTMGCFILLIYNIGFKHDKKVKLVIFLNYVISVISAFLVRSATIKISILLFLVCVIIYIFRKIFKKLRFIFNYKMYLFVAIISFLLIVFGNIQNNFVGALNLLGRDTTFTGRTEIWQETIDVVKENFVIGTGYMAMDTRLQKMKIYHAHSTYLNVFLETGVIGAVLYLIILISLQKFLRNIKEDKIKLILEIAIFTYLIITIFEVYIYIEYFITLLLLITNYSTNKKLKIKDDI